MQLYHICELQAGIVSKLEPRTLRDFALTRHGRGFKHEALESMVSQSHLSGLHDSASLSHSQQVLPLAGLNCHLQAATESQSTESDCS